MYFISTLIRKLIARPDYWAFAFWLPLFLSIWLVIRFKGPKTTRISSPRLWPALGLLVLAVFGWFCWVQQFSPIYPGPIQPQIADVSWYFAQGKPIYQNQASGEVYNLLYGPDLYIITGLFEKILSPTAFSFKLPSTLAMVGTVLGIAFYLRKFVGWGLALFGASLFASLVLALNPEEIFGRADVFIVLSIILGCWSASSRHKLAPLALGMFVGIGLNLKIHALFYFIPALWLGWENGYRLQKWLLAACAAIVMAAAPFILLPNVSFANYLWTLNIASGHGFDPMNYFNLLEVFFGFGIPVATAALLAYRQDSRQTANGLTAQKPLLLALVTSFILLLVPCSKYGAGLHHLLPMGLWVIILGARLYSSGVRPNWDGSMTSCGLLAVLGSWMISCLGIGLVRSYQNAEYLKGRALWAENVETDLDQIIHQYSSGHILLMGVTNNANYEYAYFRPHLVFEGQPIGFDPCALMDREFADSAVPDLSQLTSAEKAAHPGNNIIWILPKNGPVFSITSYFAKWETYGYLPSPPAYNEQFRANFQSTCRKFASTQFYDLYAE